MNTQNIESIKYNDCQMINVNMLKPQWLHAG